MRFTPHLAPRLAPNGAFSANYKFLHCGPHFIQLTKHAQLTQLSRKSHCSVLAPSAFSLDSLFLRRLSPASSPVAHASHLVLFFTARVLYIDLFQYCCEAAEIYEGTPKAKATLWVPTDAGVRKHGERTGLDTLVVHAVNDECSPLVYADQGPS